MNRPIDPEQFGEFKGTTGAKLEMIFFEIQGLRTDVTTLNKQVNELNQWKSWTMGASAIIGIVGGFVAGFLRDYLNIRG